MGSTGAALLAAILLAIPFVIFGLIVIVIGAIFGAFEGLLKILAMGPRYWILSVWITLNVVILVPLFLIVYLGLQEDPSGWQETKGPILTFVAFFVTPTIFQYIYCKVKDHREERSTHHEVDDV